MDIKPFGVELWMNEFELQCEFNLAETCVESITIAQLLELAGRDETTLSELLPLKMTYGAIEGSDRLRSLVPPCNFKQQCPTISTEWLSSGRTK